MRKSLIHTSLERGGRAATTKARLSRFNGLHCETVETVSYFNQQCWSPCSSKVWMRAQQTSNWPITPIWVLQPWPFSMIKCVSFLQKILGISRPASLSQVAWHCFSSSRWLRREMQVDERWARVRWSSLASRRTRRLWFLKWDVRR